jgi:hypothetical protein
MKNLKILACFIMVSLLAVSCASAIEINELSNRISVKLQYWNAAGLDLPPDSVLVFVTDIEGDSLGALWATADTSWVKTYALGSSDVTCWILSPALADLDFGGGEQDYVIHFGAHNTADSATDWYSVPVQLKREVYADLKKIDDDAVSVGGLKQVYENPTASGNMESFFDNSGSSKIAYLDVDLDSIRKVVRDHALADGAVDGCTQLFYPPDSEPNDSTATFYGGSLLFMTHFDWSFLPDSSVKLDSLRAENRE